MSIATKANEYLIGTVVRNDDPSNDDSFDDDSYDELEQEEPEEPTNAGEYVPSAYERMTHRRIARNKAYLEHLGLGAPVVTPPPKKRKRTSPPKGSSARRTSLRICGKPALYEPALDDGCCLLDDNFASRHSKNSRPNKKKQSSRSQRILSPEERRKLECLPDWVEDMSAWLRTVPHGNQNKPVSPENARQVMEKINMLVAGVGIEYRHWQVGVLFKGDVSINLGADTEQLLKDAKAMESRHGRDKGNGWLLRHPIVKLQLYQQYRAEQLT